VVGEERFVGRQAELALLGRRLIDARAGSGRVVLISGPAGIGKTRLVEEFVAASGGMRTGWGNAVADAGAPALWPWIRALRGLPGPHAALASLVAGDTQAAYGSADDAAATTFAADTRVVDALADEADAGAGLLLVLDDLHWADRATLRLLERAGSDMTVLTDDLIFLRGRTLPGSSGDDPGGQITAGKDRPCSTSCRTRGA